MTLQQQRWEDAWGATLLFLTNAIGIILVAAIVFVLMGFVSLARLRTYWSEARASLATVLVSGLVIMIPLGLTGDEVSAPRPTRAMPRSPWPNGWGRTPTSSSTR